MFDGSIHSDGSLEATDEHDTEPGLEEEFLERDTDELAVKCDINEMVELRDAEIQTEFCERESVLKESAQLCNAAVQADFHECPDSEYRSLESENGLSFDSIETTVSCARYNSVTETSCQCNILQVESFDGGMTVKINGSDICKFKKVMDSKNIGIQSTADEFNLLNDGKNRPPLEETSLLDEKLPYNGSSSFDTGVDSAVQCNIIGILTHNEDILEIFNEFKSLRFKKIPASNDIAVQTDTQKGDIFNNDEMVEGIIDDDNDVMGGDVTAADDIPSKAFAIVPDVEDVGVREKHDGEPSEKALLGLGWKDFVDSSELGDDVKLLDCLVYEKEDVFIVICESYRKYCKEISSNDYTFDFDEIDDNVTNDHLGTCLNEQNKHSSNVITCDNSILDKPGEITNENDHCESADKTFEDSNKKVLKAKEQASVLLKTVTEGDSEKCEIGIQCDSHENEFIRNVEKRCPHCMRPLSSSTENITNNTSKTRSLSRDVDGFILCPHVNGDEDVPEMGGGVDDEADFTEEFQPKTADFAFREMCDFAVQCDLRDVVDLARCLYCGHCKTSCSDFAVQCEIADILSSSFPDGFDRSSGDIPCNCGRSRTSCSDAAVQCEFLDLLSSSNSMLGDISKIPVVLQEDEGESLIKEVMALAKECSQNDALIDQHWNEVVQGQGLFNLIQDGENNDEDSGKEEISPTNENSLDLYSEIPENEQVILLDANSEESDIPNFLWKEFRDVETQCGEDVSLEKEEKAVQCTLLEDEQQFGIQKAPADKEWTGEKVSYS